MNENPIAPKQPQGSASTKNRKSKPVSGSPPMSGGRGGQVGTPCGEKYK